MRYTLATHPLLIVALVIGTLCAIALPGAPVAQASSAPYRPDELIVRLNSATPEIDAVNADYGTATIEALTILPNSYLLSTPPGEDVATTLARMSGDSRIAAAEPNYLVGEPEANPRKISVWGGPSAAPRYEQYALAQLGVEAARDYGTGAGVTVAVIDTGVEFAHPALAANLLYTGYDFIDGDDCPEELGDGLDNDGDGLVDEALGHGTHVAGTVLLVAPGAKIMPIRALEADGTGELYVVAAAIEYAVARGADVINLSLGTDIASELLSDAVRNATRAGVLVVAAAGNTGGQAPEYPAADSCAVAVTALDEERRFAPDAATGPWVDLAAPGEAIYSALVPGGYGWWSGTSMATPFVSGQAALLKAIRPEMNLGQLATLMVFTAQPYEGEGRDSPEMIDIGSSARIAAAGHRFSTRQSFIPRDCIYTPVDVDDDAEDGAEDDAEDDGYEGDATLTT